MNIIEGAQMEMDARLAAAMLEAYLAIELESGKTRKLNLLPSGSAALAMKAAADVAQSVARQRIPAAKPVVSNARVQIQSRLVDDPAMTDSEFLYQKGQAHIRAEADGRKPNLNVGRVVVQENAITRIGGLCYIKQAKFGGKRELHHERAAEWIKSAYEASFGSQPAMDPSREQVDTSPTANDSGMAARVDHGRKLWDLMEHLGSASRRRIVAIVVMERPVQEIADGNGWRATGRVVDALLDDLDKAAVFLQIASHRAARQKENCS